MCPKPMPARGSKLDADTAYVDRQMLEGWPTCAVLHLEVCALGYTGSYSTVVKYRRPRRYQW